MYYIRKNLLLQKQFCDSFYNVVNYCVVDKKHEQCGANLAAAPSHKQRRAALVGIVSGANSNIQGRANLWLFLRNYNIQVGLRWPTTFRLLLFIYRAIAFKFGHLIVIQCKIVTLLLLVFFVFWDYLFICIIYSYLYA